LEVSSVNQAYVFLAMIVCGGVCTFIFDVFRGIRRYKNSGSGIIAVQDLVFWAIELTVVYLVAFRLNYARVRAYELIALLIGSVIYFVTLSDWVIRLVCSGIKFGVGIFIKIAFPFQRLCNILVLPLKKLKVVAGKKAESLKTKILLKFTIALKRTRNYWKKKTDLCRKKQKKNTESVQ